MSKISYAQGLLHFKQHFSIITRWVRLMWQNFVWRYSYNRIDEASKMLHKKLRIWLWDLWCERIEASRRAPPLSNVLLLCPGNFSNQVDEEACGVNWEHAGVAASVKSYSRRIRAQWSWFFFLLLLWLNSDVNTLIHIYRWTKSIEELYISYKGAKTFVW